MRGDHGREAPSTWSPPRRRRPADGQAAAAPAPAAVLPTSTSPDRAPARVPRRRSRRRQPPARARRQHRAATTTPKIDPAAAPHAQRRAPTGRRGPHRPFSFDVPLQLPRSLLRCGASLRRLYLGVWLFPFTTGLPRSPDVFPHLQELGICHGITEERDLEYVLACSPKLETLALISNYGYPDRVRIGSHSLRCVLLWHSLADEVAVMAAPHLQRLIIYFTFPNEAGTTIKVKIGYAPELSVLGYLDTAKHVLEIGNTIIKAGVTKVSPNTVVPSVKVLALKARFRVAEEVRTLLSFLRCFPEVETLHIMASDNNTEHYDDPGEVKARDRLNSTFWQGVGPIKCVQSRVKKVVFDQFTGGTNQVGFLKMVLGRAVLLQEVIVLLVGPDSITVSEATRKLRPLVSKKMWASKVLDETSLEVRGRAAGPVWRYSEASDLSISDPFIS